MKRASLCHTIFQTKTTQTVHSIKQSKSIHSLTFSCYSFLFDQQKSGFFFLFRRPFLYFGFFIYCRVDFQFQYNKTKLKHLLTHRIKQNIILAKNMLLSFLSCHYNFFFLLLLFCCIVCFVRSVNKFFSSLH